MVQPFERALNQIAQNTSVMAEQLPIITDSVKKIYQVESEEKKKDEKKSVEKERIEADTAGGKGDNAELLRELGGLASSMAGIRALLKNNLNKGEGGIAEMIGNVVRGMLPGGRGRQNGGFVYNSPIQGFKQGGGVYTVPGNGSGDKHFRMLPVGSFVLNRNASNFIDSRQSGGLVPTMLESQEKVFSPGSWSGLIPILNSVIPRFQSGGLIEHLHGDPSRTGYDYSHGTESNAHDHFAFSDTATKDYVKKELQKLGYIIGSETTGMHAKNSYHYSNQAFDIPWSQFGSGPITEQDYIKSRQLLKDVNNILAKLNNKEAAEAKQPVPGMTGLDFSGNSPSNDFMQNPLAKLFGFPSLSLSDLFPGFMSLGDLFSSSSNNSSNTSNNSSGTSSSSNIIGSDMDLLKRLVLAEAGGEGLLGQALVARSVLNRQSLIQSGDASLGTFLANDSTLRGIIMGSGQYQPITDGRIHQSFTEEQLQNAAKAIEMAQNTASLRGNLEARNISPGDINNLLNSTGFRTGAAFHDPSQNNNVTQFGNHFFNTSGNSSMDYKVA